MGGGLISGIAAYVKRLRPEIRIVGVEPVDSDAMSRSLAAAQHPLQFLGASPVLAEACSALGLPLPLAAPVANGGAA